MNDRFDHDPRWAETGDRYIIKLFRDYVFHQVDENGRPVTDLSHVLSNLNKVRSLSLSSLTPFLPLPPFSQLDTRRNNLETYMRTREELMN